MRFSLAAALAPPEHYLPLALLAEDLGYGGVCVPDGPFFPASTDASYPYSADGSRFWSAGTPFVDPWVVIPAMAAVTERISFATIVLKLPLRHPLLLAKTLATCACLAPGRITLGVGLSWLPEEFSWLGLDFASRGRRTDESIAALRALLAPGEVEHHGEFFDFGPLTQEPTPAGGIPVQVGGMSQPALRRAARLGDGWIGTPTPVAELADVLRTLHALREQAGTSERPFVVTAMPSPQEGASLDTYRRMAELGVDEVVVAPWFAPRCPLGSEPLQTKRSGAGWFAENIMARL